MPAILENVNTQLLESDFTDSMVAGTGIPQNAIGADSLTLKGPILVEVTNIMEIGHSAYSLLQVHESRVEYSKQSQILRANGDAEERKPMPKFPRSMLQFQLSDGQLVLPAIECKRLPQFELGETPLGFKVSSPPLRRTSPVITYSSRTAAHKGRYYQTWCRISSTSVCRAQGTPNG